MPTLARTNSDYPSDGYLLLSPPRRQWRHTICRNAIWQSFITSGSGRVHKITSEPFVIKIPPVSKLRCMAHAFNRFEYRMLSCVEFNGRHRWNVFLPVYSLRSKVMMCSNIIIKHYYQRYIPANGSSVVRSITLT